MLQFLNANVITPYQIKKANVLIANEKIISINNKVIKDIKKINAANCYLAPGFIDIHVHGGGGADLMDGDINSILKIAETHAKYGTTAFYPTTLTAIDEELDVIFNSFNDAKKKNKNGATIMGIHLEGPYLSSKQKGAQDERYLKNPDKSHYEKIINSTDNIARITAAPELPGALELGNFLSKNGIIASIGHTDAEYYHMVEALNSGYNLLTHFYSGMSNIKRVNSSRVLGAVESGYLFDDFFVEIIADGFHLPAELLKLIYKIKGPDKIALVTDAMRGAGMGDGKSILGSLKNGIEVIIEEGIAKMPNRQVFAGSVATMDRLVRNMVKLAEVPLREAVIMASTTPARIMGIEQEKGSIAPGKDADLVLLNSELEVLTTIIKGKLVFNKNNPK